MRIRFHPFGRVWRGDRASTIHEDALLHVQLQVSTYVDPLAIHELCTVHAVLHRTSRDRQRTTFAWYHTFLKYTE